MSIFIKRLVRSDILKFVILSHEHCIILRLVGRHFIIICCVFSHLSEQYFIVSCFVIYYTTYNLFCDLLFICYRAAARDL